MVICWAIVKKILREVGVEFRFEEAEFRSRVICWAILKKILREGEAEFRSPGVVYYQHRQAHMPLDHEDTLKCNTCRAVRQVHVTEI